MAYTYAGGLVVLDQPGSYSVTHTTPTISGQAASVYIPTSDPGYPPVIFCHAASGDQTVVDSGVTGNARVYLAARGFVCAASNLHGDSWGNASSITDIENLLAHLDTNSNADVSKVFLVGLSMGMVTACAYVRNGAAQVQAIASLVGCCDLGYMHDTAGFETAIDTAYTNHAGYVAAYNTRDPYTIATGGYLNTIPVGLWWGSSDTTTGPTQTQAFKAAAPLAEYRQDVTAHLGIGYTDGHSVGSWIYSKQASLARARTLVV